MDRIKSIGFIDFLFHRVMDIYNRIKNSDKRIKNFYITFFISIIIIIIAFIFIFTSFSIFSDTNDELIFDEFNRVCLKSHNYYRSLHGVPPLQLDETIIKFAKERADYLVSTDIFAHPKDLKEYGENLHYIMPTKSYPCDKVVTPWYEEIVDYNYNNPLASKGKIGHFTQVVWKNTSKVGCAQAYSQYSRRCYTVCNYYRSGNYVNRYRENVLRRVSESKSI